MHRPLYYRKLHRRKEIYKQKDKTDAAVTTNIILNIKTLKNSRTTLPLPTYPKRVKQSFSFFFFSTWSQCISLYLFNCFHRLFNTGPSSKELVHTRCWFNEGRCAYARLLKAHDFLFTLAEPDQGPPNSSIALYNRHKHLVRCNIIQDTIGRMK